MRRQTFALIGVVLGMSLAGGALAQGYYPSNDPCAPERSILGGWSPPSAQRQAACAALRKSQWDEYNAHQKAEQDQKDQEAARQQEVQAAAEAERQAAEKRQERLAAEQQRDAYVAQIAAENSPDNHCKIPDVARSLIEEWNDFDTAKENNIKVIDIEHLITTKFSPETSEIACHGVFRTNRGAGILGTLSTRKNVAGDPITTWRADASQDLSIYAAPPDSDIATIPQTLVRQTSIPDAAIEKPGAFSTGLADRQKWETWLAGLSGDEKDGATWWATNRNSPGHLVCTIGPNKDNATWEAGCLNAQQMLTPVDMKRRSDPVYKRGWNSL